MCLQACRGRVAALAAAGLACRQSVRCAARSRLRQRRELARTRLKRTQRREQLTERLETLTRVFTQRPLDCLAQLSGCRLGERAWLLLQHRRAHVLGRLALEGPKSREHLVEHDAEAPYVRARVHRLSARLLGAHVTRRAHDDAAAGAE